MKQQKAVFGSLSLFAFFIGFLVGLVSTLGMVSQTEEMASLGATIAGLGFGLMACVPGLIFAVIGLLRKEKPLWPALVGFICGVFPGGLGLYIVGKIMLDCCKHYFSSTQGVFESARASYRESYCIAKCTCGLLCRCGSMGQLKGKCI